MKNLSELLKEADPLASEAGLSAADRQRMRRDVLAMDRGAATNLSGWSPIRWVALAVAIAAGIGVAVERWPTRFEERVAVTTDPAQESAHRRQVQFVTTGGTRIVWIFNSEFELPSGSNR